MGASRALTPWLRAATFETLIGLLAVSAFAAARRSGLTAAMSTSSTARCTSVLRSRTSGARCRCTTRPHAPLTTTAGCATGTCPSRLHPRFRILQRHAALGRRVQRYVREAHPRGRAGRSRRGARPRAHDLRHSFAVRTLIDWYEADENIDAKLPLLSAFLGHVDPVSSYWYLPKSPELLALARDHLERTGIELS